MIDAVKRSLSGEFHARILWIGPHQLSHGSGGRRKRHSLSIDKEWIGHLIQQRDGGASSLFELRCRLAEQTVGNLVDLLRKLSKVGTLGTDVGCLNGDPTW